MPARYVAADRDARGSLYPVGRRPAGREAEEGNVHVWRSLDDVPKQPPVASVVTIGNFDGVHLGHQALLH
jgi:hypothetical protein